MTGDAPRRLAALLNAGRHAARLLLVVALVAVALAPARAEPGAVVSLEFRETFSTAGVDAQTAGRFRNDGQTPPRVRTAVDSYLMRFETVGLDGSRAEAVAHLFVPQVSDDRATLFAFAPGSTGLVDTCAPSSDYVAAGRLDTYGAYGLAWAGQGIPTVVPNYLGFFDPDTIQPYFIAEAEATLVLDALRAAGTALSSLEAGFGVEHAFVGGYSQGGHAALATADRAAAYAPDVPLRGVIGFGPSSMVDVTLRAFTFVAPWILVAYAHYYGGFDPATLLVDPYAARLSDDAVRHCIAGVQSYYPGSPEGLLVPSLATALRDGSLADAHPEIAALVAENATGIVDHGLPVIILQGVDDPVAPFPDQSRYVRHLCDLGIPVRFPNYLRTRHETRYIGFEEALGWLRGRAAGEEAPNDCDLVPNG